MCMLLHCAATQWCANATCSPRERLQTHAEHCTVYQCSQIMQIYTVIALLSQAQVVGYLGSDQARASTGARTQSHKYCSATRHQPAWHVLQVLSACVAYACR